MKKRLRDVVAALVWSVVFVSTTSSVLARPPHLIMGMQNGLLTHEVRVFLASLRSTGCTARVKIFSAEDDRPDLDELALTFDAEIIHYNATSYAQYGPMNLHRFRLFRQVLEQTLHEPYDQVFLCDIRDVLFQSDPFEALSVEVYAKAEFARFVA